MGPQSRDCGKGSHFIDQWRSHPELQWGRSHVTAESAVVGEIVAAEELVLQWGRSHVTAESYPQFGET